MDLWLVRHGEAVAERVDPARPLSPEGERAIKAVAESIAGRMGSVDLMAASGKKRALQTAVIFAEAASYPSGKVEETGALSPAAPPEAFRAFLAGCAGSERVLCVGHLPSIAAHASYFLSPGDPVQLVFSPGTVCRIRINSLRRGGGELLLFL